MSIKKVQANKRQQISARDWNTLADRANARDTSRGAFGPRSDGVTDVVVQVFNGTALPRFGVIGLNAPVILPEDNEPEFTDAYALIASAPSSDTHASKFAVVQEPCPSAGGKFIRARVAGITPVRITGEYQPFAAVIHATTARLTTSLSATCAQILWAEDGDEERWALIRLGNTTPGNGVVRYQTTAEASASFSGTAGWVPFNAVATDSDETAAGTFHWWDSSGVEGEIELTPNASYQVLFGGFVSFAPTASPNHAGASLWLEYSDDDRATWTEVPRTKVSVKAQMSGSSLLSIPIAGNAVLKGALLANGSGHHRYVRLSGISHYPPNVPSLLNGYLSFLRVA